MAKLTPINKEIPTLKIKIPTLKIIESKQLNSKLDKIRKIMVFLVVNQS